MPNLYKLAESYRQFYEYMENALDNDELAEEDLQMYYDTLASIQEPLEQKAEAVVSFLKNIEGDIEAYKKEKLRLERKQKYLENKYNGLKKWLKDSLELNGIDKLQTEKFKIRLQKNNPSVELTNELAVPDEYVNKVEKHFDKKRMLDDLKSGKFIPGAVIASETKHVRFG